VTSAKTWVGGAAAGILAAICSGCSSSTPTPRPSSVPKLAQGTQAKACRALQEITDAVTDTPEPVKNALQQAQADLATAQRLVQAEGAKSVVAAMTALNTDIDRLSDDVTRGVNSQALSAATRTVSADVDAVPISCAAFD
jgi:hypothetical protein